MFNNKFAVVGWFFLTLFSMHSYAGDAKHYPGVFVGYTDNDKGTEFTLGVEYEYKFSQHWGAGAVYETFDYGKDAEADLYIASVFYHPNKYWRFGLGVGREDISGPKPKEKDVVRLCAAYEYTVGEFILAPTLAIDFVESDKAYVAGVAILYPF